MFHLAETDVQMKYCALKEQLEKKWPRDEVDDLPSPPQRILVSLFNPYVYDPEGFTRSFKAMRRQTRKIKIAFNSGADPETAIERAKSDSGFRLKSASAAATCIEKNPELWNKLEKEHQKTRDSHQLL